MNTRKIVRTGIAIGLWLAAMQMQGCVTGLTEQERYEANTLRAERMGEIRQFIKACEDAEMVALYYGPSTQKLRDPFKHIPSQARLSDYACAPGDDVIRAQRGIGISM